MPDQVTNQFIGPYERVEEVFIDAHGKDREKSVSVATQNRAGTPYRQIPAGNVLGKYPGDGLHYPLAFDQAQAVVSNANVVLVAEARNFRVGDVVELPASVASDATRFRAVTARNVTANTITLDGATFSLAQGDALEVDPSRVFGEVETTAAAPGGGGPTEVALLDGHAARFSIGNVVDIGDNEALPITAIDEAGDTITVTGDIAVTDGDRVVSAKNGVYKLPVKTVNTSEADYIPQNVLMRCRDHGEVRESNLRGLTPDAKASLKPLITFNQRWS